jgi:hypothetical protein
MEDIDLMPIIIDYKGLTQWESFETQGKGIYFLAIILL